MLWGLETFLRVFGGFYLSSITDTFREFRRTKIVSGDFRVLGFSMRFTPSQVEYLRKLIGIPSRGIRMFASFHFFFQLQCDAVSHSIDIVNRCCSLEVSIGSELMNAAFILILADNFRM